MTIKNRLFISFGVILIIMLVMGVYIYNTINKFDEISDIKAQRYEQIIEVKDLKQINTAITLTAMDIIVDKDSGEVSSERINELNKLFTQIWEKEEDLISVADTNEEKDLINNINIAFKKLEPIIKKELVNLVTSKAPNYKFEELDDAIDGAAGNMDRDIEKLIEFIEEELKEASEEEIMYAASMKRNIIIIITFVFILTGIISSWITRYISFSLYSFQSGLIGFFKYLNREKDTTTLLDDSKNDEISQMAKVVNQNILITKEGIEEDRRLIDETIAVLSEFEKGDLCQRLDINVSNPALMELKTVLNKMGEHLEHNIENILDILEQYSSYNYLNKIDTKDLKEHLLKLAGGVNSLGDSITQMLVENKSNGLTLNSSSEILLSNVESLNRSSNEAAASLEETAASLEQITGNIRGNTQNIIKMTSFSNELTKSAKEGEKLASMTTSSMENIDEQVNAIYESITVIDQIAFQTNILSLNAAVEAATAGESGKGFAVVAGEVRNLATRSAEAAKEIKDLVENATTKADEGKVISEQMIEGYKNLNSNILKTRELMSDIELSSKEQLSGIEQINSAISQLDTQTQSNMQIANTTNDIAKNTDKIAKLVVSNANNKEFKGKDSVKAKSFN